MSPRIIGHLHHSAYTKRPQSGAVEGGGTADVCDSRIMMTSDLESLDTLLRTLERSKDLRKERETLSSVSFTCFGGVSSDLPFKAIQILQSHVIIADKYVLSPHSVNLFVPVGSREAAVKALHSLI